MDVEISDLISINGNNKVTDATEIVYERVKMMLQTFQATLPNPSYIQDVQNDGFIPKWRYRTVRYMLSYSEIGLCDETLSLAINIFDRYLSRKSVHKSRIELICVVCMMLASKLIENDGTYFRVEEVVGAVKNTTEKDVCKMELDIIQTLNWQLNAVTNVSMMLHFAELTHGLLPHPKEKEKLMLYAKAFLDHGACEYDFLKYSPIVQSVSALLCAYHNANFNCVEWCKRMLLCNIDLNEYGLRQGVQACSVQLLDAFYKYYPDLELVNAKHNILITADGLRWNAYMSINNESGMVEDDVEDDSCMEGSTRMSVSPTNIMDDLHGQPLAQRRTGDEARSGSPTNVQDIGKEQQKYLCIGGKHQQNTSAAFKTETSFPSAFSVNSYHYNGGTNEFTAKKAVMMVENAADSSMKVPSRTTTRWAIGGVVGNTLTYC
eukprot:g6758.t1